MTRKRNLHGAAAHPNAMLEGRALALLLVVALAGGIPTVESVTEEVDVREYRYVKTRIELQVPTAYLEDRGITEGSLGEVCDAELAILARTSLLRCDARIVQGTDGRSKVVLTILDQPLLGVDSLSLEGGRARLDLSFEYRPKQFLFTRGYRVGKRVFTVLYPTHRIVLDNIAESAYASTFSLIGAPEALDVPLERRDYALGEQLPIPKLEGELCAAGLVSDGVVVAKGLSVGCKPFALGTSALLEPGDYTLVVVSSRLSALRAYSAGVSLKRQQLAVRLSADRERALLGEVIGLSVEADRPVERCEVSVVNMDGFRVSHSFLTDCAQVKVGTSTSWVPGRHIARVTVFSGGVEGFATAAVELMGAGYPSGGGEDVKVEPEGVMPGGTVSVHPGKGLTCDYMRLQLYDREWSLIGSEESPGCDSTRTVKVPESQPPGGVVLRAEAIEDGRTKAVSSKVLSVLEWRPAVRTQRSDLCQQGQMALQEGSLPCLSPGQLCIPSTASVPLCLCFDEGGSAADVCDYGEVCSGAGCAPTELVNSPFIIVYESGECLAKRGVQTLECIEQGELCAGSCVCLDEGGRPTSMCSFGEACAASGCQPMALQFEVVRSSARHARTDQLREGTEVTWQGPIVFEGSALDGTAEGQLSFKAVLGDDEAKVTQGSYLSPEDGFLVGATFRADLPPGRYDLFLLVEHRNATHLLREGFEVWYPEAEKDLSVSIDAVSPAVVGLSELRHGTSLKLHARIADSRGRALPYLPASALGVKLGDVAAHSIAATFSPLAQTWEVVANLRSITRPSADEVTLEVGHLGRSGRAAAACKLVERVPLSLSIVRSSPGPEEDPLYYLLVPLGFDMEIDLRLQGGDMVRKEDFRVAVAGKPVPQENVVDMISTMDGVRLYVSQIALCPDPPKPDSVVPVDVSVSSGGETASDRSYLAVRANPGGWDNLKEVSC